MKDFFIGIDPGLTGGITLINNKGEIIDWKVMPVKKGNPLSKSKIVLDTDEIIYTILHWYGIESEISGKSSFKIFIEKQWSMHGQGLSSTFKTAQNYGILLGILSVICSINLLTKDTGPNIDYETITSIQWHRNIDVTTAKDPKQRSLDAAKHYFPQQTFLKSSLCSKPHMGLLESALIALYGTTIPDIP